MAQGRAGGKKGTVTKKAHDFVIILKWKVADIAILESKVADTPTKFAPSARKRHLGSFFRGSFFRASHGTRAGGNAGVDINFGRPYWKQTTLCAGTANYDNNLVRFWNKNWVEQRYNHHICGMVSEARMHISWIYDIVHFILKKSNLGIEVWWSMLRRPSASQWISKWQNIFGTFQIECEKFWNFLIFHEKIMKFRWFSWFSWFFSWKIKKFQKV